MNNLKKCCRCGEYKDLSKFYARKRSSDRMTYHCILCSNKESKTRSRTKTGIIGKIYRQQVASSKKRGHKKPSYSKIELKMWAFKQEVFSILYKQWVDSDYDKRKTPSFDRLKNNLPYSLENINIVTWTENNRNSHRDIRLGLILTMHRKVEQLDTNGKVISEYFSIAEASRNVLRANRNHISSVCNGKRNTTGGFVWRYK